MNATSIGLFPHVEGRLDLDLDTLRPGLVVAGVIPNPPRTQLIRDAEARDCIVLDGLGMLVSQGAISIRHWTGIEPELQVMRKKLEHIFRRLAHYRRAGSIVQRNEFRLCRRRLRLI